MIVYLLFLDFFLSKDSFTMINEKSKLFNNYFYLYNYLILFSQHILFILI
jgi:hypothetical protein